MSQRETVAEILGRSAFGFALLFFLSALMTWIAFLLSPVSPDPTFAQLRMVIIVVAGIGVLALFAICVWLLKTDEENLTPIGKKIVAGLGKPWVAILTAVLLLEVNFIAGIALINVAPPFVQPGRFLLASWSIIIVMMLLVIHWQALTQQLKRTQLFWTALGLMLSTLFVIGILYLVTTQLVNSSGINNQLRGGLDYRPLTFIDDGQQPETAEAFWLQQAEAQVRWSPYTYWVGAAVDERYVNVSTEGLRETPQTLSVADAHGRIFIFGGSTVWGEGARDAYTIPSQLVTQLKAQNFEYFVDNYGQTGYVSSQDMFLFQLQLLRGNVPDVAIFYQGFNDTLAAYGEGLVGITLQESQRLNDSEAGRQLRQGQPLFTPLTLPLSQYNFTLAATQETTAQAIIDRWFANVAMIETIASGYGVQLLFVWQPHIMGKAQYTIEEEAILEKLEVERPGFIELYSAVDELVRQKILDDEDTNILILSDLFAGDERTIFHDLVHITEAGNQVVAEAIINTLNNNLENN